MEEYFDDDFIRDDWDEELEQAVSENRESGDSDKIALVEGLMQGAPSPFVEIPRVMGNG